jgi:hypothetical protein
VESGGGGTKSGFPHLSFGLCRPARPLSSTASLPHSSIPPLPCRANLSRQSALAAAEAKRRRNHSSPISIKVGKARLRLIKVN